jgi:hypothetical protein
MSDAKSSKRIVLHGQIQGSASIGPGRAIHVGGAPRVYLLSPAYAGGKRAQMLFRASAQFELAARLRNGSVSIGEVFSFMSPLYFRGKLAYAATFADAPVGVPGVMVITPCRGLVEPATIIGISDLEEIASEQIVLDNPKYRDPLDRDLNRLSEVIGRQGRVILLGSIKTDKYIPLLAGKLGERLLVPREFVGLGNMSRGALLLRCSREKSELEYVSAQLL